MRPAAITPASMSWPRNDHGLNPTIIASPAIAQRRIVTVIRVALFIRRAVKCATNPAARQATQPISQIQNIEVTQRSWLKALPVRVGLTYPALVFKTIGNFTKKAGA